MLRAAELGSVAGSVGARGGGRQVPGRVAARMLGVPTLIMPQTPDTYARFGRFRPIWADFGRFWEMLGGFGGLSLSGLGGIQGIFRNIPGNFRQKVGNMA